MILTIYLLKKFIKFLFISIAISYSIFFIFSLLGSLGENFNFVTILQLSALNSLNIYSIIPSHLFLLAIFIFIIDLKSKNELIVIKEYFHINRLFLMIFPVIIIFIYIEFYKESLSTNINKIKSDLININSNENTKIVVKTSGYNKTYSIFKSSNKKSNQVDEFLLYEIQNKNIKNAKFSNNLYMNMSDLYSNNQMIFNDNKFKYDYSNTKLYTNFENFWNNEPKVIYQSKLNDIKSSFYNIYSIFFYILFYFCISIILFGKNIVNRNLNIQKIVLIILFLFLYFLIIPKITLSYFHYYFQIISLVIFAITFLQIRKYE